MLFFHSVFVFPQIFFFLISEKSLLCHSAFSPSLCGLHFCYLPLNAADLDLLVVVIDLVRRCRYGLQLPWVERCCLLSGHCTPYTVPNPPLNAADLVSNFNRSSSAICSSTSTSRSTLVRWWLIWSGGHGCCIAQPWLLVVLFFFINQKRKKASWMLWGPDIKKFRFLSDFRERKMVTRGLDSLHTQRERERGELAACSVKMDYQELWVAVGVAVCVLLLLGICLGLKASKSEQKVKNVCDEGNTSADTAGSSSSTSKSGGGVYEVFLSFRGKDTRKSFTDYLYHDLDHAGIRTFRDDDELRVGEKIGLELLKAIGESKILIPIFSRDYASSKWCLRELAKMVECHNDDTKKQKIFPIFYDVTPSDVRHQGGTYKKAFRKHQKDFKEDTVRRWKDALRVVGGMKGLELEKETHGYEGELVKKVVSNVFFELKKTTMVLPDNLVGIEHHVQKIKRLVKVSSNDVRIVGIYGICGIGKTTIAKFIYNELSELFECCCFLEDVREMSKHKSGLFDLQKQFISKILKIKCPDIGNEDDGINTIKESIRQKKVLIVLDDINEESQFKKLVGDRDCFCSGSRIIVTTRNKDVLNKLKVDETYEPPFMELCHSLQLFNKHVFKRDTPPEGYDILSKSIASIAAGLPFAIKAIGSSLLCKEKEVWKAKLTQLKDKLDDDVYTKLRTSYDDLNPTQKQMFLDIACLFIGEDKRLPFYMWDACKFYPIVELDGLQLKSLVKIEDDKWLWMHDLFRDLGRQIVREEEEPSRLIDDEDALNVLESQMERRKVTAICVEAYNHCFTNEEFRNLPDLRVLCIDYAKLDGDFKQLLSKLRWLQWRKCPGNSTPTNFHLKNLVILDLSNSCDLKDDWEGWSQLKMAEKLKVLNLSGCNGLTKTPDFSTFTALEVLNLSNSKYLKDDLEDWSQIKMVKKLKVLNLSRCNGFTKTPDFSTLTALEILNIGKRENSVEIHPSVWKLKNLRVLDISGSDNNTAIRPIKFPDEIGNLEKLEEMDASGSDLHGEIPSSIGKLSSLRILRLCCPNIYCLPPSICGLSRLETLDLFNCHKLQSLPDELPSSLTRLRVT